MVHVLHTKIDLCRLITSKTSCNTCFANLCIYVCPVRSLISFMNFLVHRTQKLFTSSGDSMTNALRLKVDDVLYVYPFRSRPVAYTNFRLDWTYYEKLNW